MDNEHPPHGSREDRVTPRKRHECCKDATQGGLNGADEAVNFIASAARPTGNSATAMVSVHDPGLCGI